MRQSASAIGLIVFLALASGVIWFAWSARDFGDSCGFRLPGYPSGPTTTGEVLLISLPAVIVAVVQALQTRSWRRVLGWGVLAAVLSAAAVGVAVLIWIVSRRCGE